MESISLAVKAAPIGKSVRSASAASFKEKFPGGAAGSGALPPLQPSSGKICVRESSNPISISKDFGAPISISASRLTVKSSESTQTQGPRVRRSSEPAPIENQIDIGTSHAAGYHPAKETQNETFICSSDASFGHPGALGRRAAGPVSMTRAKTWSADVENSFRLQLAGFQDLVEYEHFMSTSPLAAGEGGGMRIPLWPESGFIKCLQNKKTGFFMYFRPHRECEDKYVNRVKIYTR